MRRYAAYSTGATSTVRIPIRWSALEVFAGMRFTTRSDVWSFGMLLVEMYTCGARPMSEVPLDAVFARINDGYVPYTTHSIIS